MRIVCPSCTAAYDVPGSLLISHKAVRCARCSEEWLPAGLDPVPPFAAAPRPIDDQPPRQPRRDADLGAMAIDRLMATPQPKPRRNGALRLAWLGSIVLVMALLGAAYGERASVMAVWPPSIRLYSALGLVGPPP
jgi:predicted Zn finger-like uncharacterized protein